ncbi:unannotated protein [freshwater metagenome]|uniref:Unannotated protein n=1 Tax=freshwater metagenome TaxID=449393 RepID=A0A6J6BKH4_9ZZZZ|nr:DUF1501 domain-containing protein [Actinomycetota bacterium]
MNQTTMNQQMLPPTDLAPTKPATAELAPTGLTRRRFLRNSGIAVAAAGSASLLHTQLASAQGGATAAAAGTGNTLLVIFCRGGMDGLSLVAPVATPEYYSLRPSIAVPQQAALALGGTHADSRFALHPAAVRLSGMYNQGSVAIVNSAGVMTSSRSHFDAQSFLEGGAGNTNMSPTGWAGRWMSSTVGASDHPLRCVAIGGGLPASLRGGSAVAASGFGSLSLLPWGPSVETVTTSTTDLYNRAGVHPALTPWAAPTLGTIAQVSSLTSTDRPASFPDTEISRNLWPIARLLQAGFPIEIAHAEMHDWDTHDAMGSATATTARMYTQVSELDTAIGAFFDYLGAAASKVTIAVVSEFGRRAYENSSGGCDHGRAFPMMVIGGGVAGGTYGDFQGLSSAGLDQGDVRVTTDYRTVLSELLSRRLGASSSVLNTTFPQFSATNSWLGVAAA